MTSISDTVRSSLAQSGYGSYQQYAAPVVTALVDREQQIVAQIVEFAQGRGLNPNDARDVLSSMGMEVPAQAQPAPAAAMPTLQTTAGEQPEQDTPEGIEAVLARIENSLAGLTAFARENGYRG